MLMAELSKIAKVAIVSSVLLIVPLAQNIWAREARGKADRSQNAPPAQKVDKSPQQDRARSSNPRTASTIQETPRVAQPVQPPSQPSQRQVPPSIEQRSDRARFQPAPNPQPTVSISQPITTTPASVASPASAASKETQRHIYRVPTTPGGVEIRRLTGANPTSQSQVITQAPNTTIRGKTDAARPSIVTIEQPRNSGGNINADKVKIRTIDSGRTSRIARPIVQLAAPTVTEKGRGDIKQANAADADKKTVIERPVKEIKSSDNVIESWHHTRDSKPETPAVGDKTAQKLSGETGKTKDAGLTIGRGDNDKARISGKDAESKPGKQTQDLDRKTDKIKDAGLAIGSGDHDKKGIAGKGADSGISKEAKHSDKNRPGLFERDRKGGAADKTEFVRNSRNTVQVGKDDRDFKRFRPATTKKVIYEDRNFINNRKFHHDNDFIFRDRHNRLNNYIIHPRYSYPVCYDWGHGVSIHYVYPYYERRFVFVSLGGFWPDYSCVRYYWYPAHSFWWYGYYPVAQQVQGDTYNYYTYNYYTTEPAATTGYISGATTVTPVNADTFADVRAKLNAQQNGPDAATFTDTLFDEGVTSFGNGYYELAEERFAKAMAAAPEDIILPFAYGQALVAQGKYTQAAEILRLALQKSSPDKQGVYFPRGLYLDENTLMDQIDSLAKAAQNNPSDSDLQLLLGYQLLGIGETEKAIEPLNTAKENPGNSAAAALLLDLAEKIKTGETQ